MPEDLVLKPNRIGSALLCLAAISGVTVCVIGNFYALWRMGAVAGCGLVAIGSALVALPGSCFIRLTPFGIIYVSFFSRRHVRWSDIDEIFVQKTGQTDNPVEIVALRLTNASGGAVIELPSVSMQADKVAVLLTKWKNDDARPEASQNPPPFIFDFITRKPTPILVATVWAGYICVALSLIACPPVFSAIGFALGTLLEKKGQRLHAGRIKLLSLLMVGFGMLMGALLLVYSDYEAEQVEKAKADGRFFDLKEFIKRNPPEIKF